MDGQQSPTMKDKYFSYTHLMNINNQFQSKAYYLDQVKQQNEKQIHVIKDNKVFLILGTMTSGKTVVQYYLCQDQLVHGIEESKKLPYIIPENVYKNALIQKTPSTITTRVPNIREITLQSSQSNQSVLFIQVPDIKQLKPQQQSLQYTFLQRIFKQCKRLHLLIVIEQTTLCDVSEMIQSFQCITELLDIEQLQVRQKISECMSIVVNKVSEDSQDSDVRASLEEANQEAIAQQSQQLSEIITTLLKQDRVYIIKNTQPKINEQKQLLDILIKYSAFSSFSQHQLLHNHLNEIIDSQQIVEKFVQKMQLKKYWQTNINNLQKVLRFMTDPKVFIQNSQQNQLLIQQVVKMLQNQYQLIDKPKLSKIDTTTLFQSGKKPNPNVLLTIQNFIKTIQNIQTLQQQSFYSHFKQITQLLKQIKNVVRQQILLQLEKIQNKQKVDNSIPQNHKIIVDYVNSSLSLKILLNLTNNLSIILNYITTVLNHDPQNSKAQQQKYFTKKCLIQLTQQLLQTVKQTFVSFDLSLLATNKKSKSTKKSKTITIKKPNPAISQLKKQFMNQLKIKKNYNLIDQIIALPVSHFKLYLLIQLFKEFLSKIDINQQFSTITIIIKQIASILHFYQFFITQIKFLLIIPDWNRISIIVDTIQRYQMKTKQNYANQQQIEFLNKLAIYVKQKRLNKLSSKLNTIVDHFIQTHRIIKSNIKSQPYLKERQNIKYLQDNWFNTYLSQQYKQNVSQKRPFSPIIQKAKQYEENNLQKIHKLNQQMFLMKQRFN